MSEIFPPASTACIGCKAPLSDQFFRLGPKPLLICRQCLCQVCDVAMKQTWTADVPDQAAAARPPWPTTGSGFYSYAR